MSISLFPAVAIVLKVGGDKHSMLIYANLLCWFIWEICSYSSMETLPEFLVQNVIFHMIMQYFSQQQGGLNSQILLSFVIFLFYSYMWVYFTLEWLMGDACSLVDRSLHLFYQLKNPFPSYFQSYIHADPEGCKFKKRLMKIKSIGKHSFHNIVFTV